MSALAAQVLDRLRAAGATLAVAESLTGGLLVAELVSVPGASDALRGGVVAYATDLKASLLDVSRELLDARGPVDAEVARQMAAGVRDRLGATVGVATTGVAGPGPQDGYPAGTVFLGVRTDGGARAVRLGCAGDRSAVRAAAVTGALELLLEVLADEHRRP